jgi:hypothetical protein
MFLRHLFRKRRNPVPRVFVLPANVSPDLTPEDRKALREWLSSPLTKQALALTELQQPGILIAGSGTAVRSEFDRDAVVNRFHQLQGWQAYRTALLTIADEPTKESEPEETFGSGHED